MIAAVASALGGYLLGSLPTAALIARAVRTDVFEVGSGNMGAMNTARNIGWLAGAAVLLLDAGKGAAAVLLGGWLAGALDGPELTAALVAGVMAVVGHCFSLFVAFRGGKGLATLLGITLPLYPLAGAGGLLILGALYLLTRRVRLAVTLALVLYPPLVPLVTRAAGWPPEEVWLALSATVAAAMVAYTKHLLAWRSETARASSAA